MIFAERKFTGRTLFNLTKKVSIDQFMIGPILMMCFFTYNEGEQNKDFEIDVCSIAPSIREAPESIKRHRLENSHKFIVKYFSEMESKAQKTK